MYFESIINLEHNAHHITGWRYTDTELEQSVNMWTHVLIRNTPSTFSCNPPRKKILLHGTQRWSSPGITSDHAEVMWWKMFHSATGREGLNTCCCKLEATFPAHFPHLVHEH